MNLVLGGKRRELEVQVDGKNPGQGFNSVVECLPR
jgi:hypothetical protein